MGRVIEQNIENIKALVVVVNYNLNLDNSKTFKNLKEIQQKLKKNYDLFVWDNLARESNLEIFRSEFDIKNNFYYKSNENETLAKIYNHIIENYLKKYEYFIFLDNDSSITEDFFIEFEKIANEEKEIDLILPKIVYKSKVFSPQKNFPHKFKKSIFYSNIDFGIKNTKDVVAINSGMIISTSYLKKNNYKYNEKFKFYGTDNYFMYNYNQNSKKYYLMNYTLEHDFSMANLENIDKALWRYSDVLNGQLLLAENYKGIEKKIYMLKIIKNLVIKIINYKKFEFLKIFSTIYLKRQKDGK